MGIVYLVLFQSKMTLKKKKKKRHFKKVTTAGLVVNLFRSSLSWNKSILKSNAHQSWASGLGMQGQEEQME